jgi:hypothetical protein
MPEPVRPPRDGWIIIRPGEAIELDIETPVSPTPQQLQHHLKTIRGSILAAAFDIESVVDTILSEFFCDSVDSKKSNKLSIFQDLLLRDLLSLEKKLRLIREVAETSFGDFPEAITFFRKADELRILRNLIAHYPAWLEAVKIPNSPRVVGFKAYIAKGSKVWELNETQISEWNSLIQTTMQTGENFIKHLTGQKSNPPSS